MKTADKGFIIPPDSDLGRKILPVPSRSTNESYAAAQLRDILSVSGTNRRQAEYASIRLGMENIAEEVFGA